jgi:hypothetical protein
VVTSFSANFQVAESLGKYLHVWKKGHYWFDAVAHGW